MPHPPLPPHAPLRGALALRGALSLALLCALSACPGRRAQEAREGAREGAQEREGERAPCARVGDRCKLGGGALGVCSPGEGGGLQCTPQH